MSVVKPIKIPSQSTPNSNLNSVRSNLNTDRNDEIYSPIANSKLRRGGTVIEDTDNEDYNNNISSSSTNTPRRTSQLGSSLSNNNNMPARRRKSNLSVITSIPPLTPHSVTTNPRVSILQEEELGNSLRRVSKSMPTSPMKTSPSKEMFPSLISESPSDLSISNSPSLSRSSSTTVPPAISPIKKNRKDIYLPTITNADSEKYYDLKEVDEGEEDRIEIKT